MVSDHRREVAESVQGDSVRPAHDSLGIRHRIFTSQLSAATLRANKISMGFAC